VPLFEVEGERPHLVRTPRSGVGSGAHRVVESHIDGLLGEQIFPVAPGAGPDEPHLLAVDATGAPVVVELVAELDEAALARALDHAGAAGRMTRAQLAARYHAGPQAFQQDIAEFYDSVPMTRTQPGRGGARLIVICQEARQDVLNAIDFLRQPAMPVEVLRMAMLHGADGRRFIDVSPLVIHPASAPDSPQIVATPSTRPLTAALPVVVQAPGAQEAEQQEVEQQEVEQQEAEQQEAGRETVGGAAPAAEAAPGADADAPAAAAPAGRTPTPAPKSAPTPAAAVPAEPRPVTGEVPEGMRTTITGRVPRVPLRRRSRTDRFSAADTPAETPAGTPAEPASGTPSAADPAPGPGPATGPTPALATGEVPAATAEPWSTPPTSPPVPVAEETDPDLIALASSIGADTTLVWSRPRRRQRFEAVLRPDGVIELPDGGRYRHPDVAAIAVSGSRSADGWVVWRLEKETGPTLADAFRERFA
jgi:hypothetical protein